MLIINVPNIIDSKREHKFIEYEQVRNIIMGN